MSIIASFEQQLNEQADLFSQEWKSPRDVQRWLTKNGYRKIGSGSFAVAYAKAGDNKVIRISLKEDYCWFHFMEWRKKQGNTRYLPRIFNTVEFQGERNGKPQRFSITAAERLQTLTPAAVMQTRDLEGLAELYTTGTVTHDIKNAIERRFVKEGIRKEQIPEWLDQHHHNEFTYAMNALDQLADDTECFLDFHFENVMYRSSDKSLVLIDPLADMAHLTM